MQEKRYSNQQSNSPFQPQTYRQLGFEQLNLGRTETHSSSTPIHKDSGLKADGIIGKGTWNAAFGKDTGKQSPQGDGTKAGLSSAGMLPGMGIAAIVGKVAGTVKPTDRNPRNAGNDPQKN